MLAGEYNPRPPGKKKEIALIQVKTCGNKKILMKNSHVWKQKMGRTLFICMSGKDQLLTYFDNGISLWLA